MKNKQEKTMHHLFLIKEKIQKFKPKIIQNAHKDLFKKSAIFIPCIINKQEVKLLMTKRSPKLKHHKGEMSFPGGQFDKNKDKDLKDTALRETEEEIGINKQDIEIFGTLSEHPTLTRYIIKPFVGTFKKEITTFQPNPSEVEEIVLIPIKEILHKEFKQIPVNNTPYSLLSFQYEDPQTNKKYTIWGASAHIIAEFIYIVYGKKKTTKQYRRPNLEEILNFQNKKLTFLNKEIK